MQQWHFIIPDPTSFRSGGNAYNIQLITALNRSGLHVSHSAFQPHVLHASPHTGYILDSIYFSLIDRPEEQLPAGCIGLVHHLESLYPLSDDVYETTERALLTAFTGLLVTSDFTKRYLTEKGIEAAAVHVIEPAPLMSPLPRTASAKVRALMLGSLTPRKGQLEFLEALAASNTLPYYVLTIAGSLTADPAYTRACQDVVRHSAALSKCVRFTGEQDPAAIPRLYQDANLFISASHMETFGMAIQDAVVSGLPVLVREGGYAGEHVQDGQNGVRCSGTQDLVTAFHRCVSDPDSFSGLKKRAQEGNLHYITWDKAAELFSEAFLHT